MQSQKRRSRVNRRTNQNRVNPRRGTGFRPAVQRDIVRPRRHIVADEADVLLTFVKTGSSVSGSTAQALLQFTPNGAYDVDPSLGSTETNGFDEYAALYSYYRVIGYTYEVTLINNDSNPLQVFITNTNVNPGTSANYELLSTNAYSQRALLSGSAGINKKTFRKRISVSALTGTPAVETADSFRSVVTSNPTDLVWLNIYASVPAGLPASSHTFSYEVRITMKIRFYSRLADLTLTASSLKDRLAYLEQKRKEYQLQKQVRSLKQ